MPAQCYYSYTFWTVTTGMSSENHHIFYMLYIMAVALKLLSSLIIILYIFKITRAWPTKILKKSDYRNFRSSPVDNFRWILTFVIKISDVKGDISPLIYSMNKFVTNKSKLPQDGAQVFRNMWWLAIMWPSERVTWSPITPYMDIIIHTI